MTRQTYPKLDVILVDANSQDGTPEAVLRLFPQTTLLQVDDESYWTASTNRGVELALEQDYDYVLTINDDCVITDDYVATLISIAEKCALPILGSRIEHFDQPGLICGMGIYPNWITSLFSYRYRDQLIQDLPEPIQTAEVLMTEGLPGNGTLIHRSVFEQVGLYEETHLPHYLSDVELIMRARRAGFSVAVTPQAVIRDDFPTPQQRASEIPTRGLFWDDFRRAFFAKGSGGKLSARVYIIRHYCPWYYQPIAFTMCGLAIGNWILRYYRLKR
jgi:GT2 family glycosyltransferase